MGDLGVRRGRHKARVDGHVDVGRKCWGEVEGAREDREREGTRGLLIEVS
jgi:hypothetical protein